MSATDEDTELRDLLVQTLDKNGVIGKIKAELRASIFLALEVQEQNKTQNPLRNRRLQKFVNTDDGQMCVQIIDEFLDHFQLDHTAAVFRPEANAGKDKLRPEEIKNSMKLAERAEKSPLLLQIIKALKSGGSSCSAEVPKIEQIQHIKKCFHAYDHRNSGAIERGNVGTVMSNAYPQMDAGMIDRFVADQLQNSISPTVTFEEFLNLCQYFRGICSSVLSVGTSTSLPLSQSSMEKKPLSEEHPVMMQAMPFQHVPASPPSESEDSKSPTRTDGIPSAYLTPSVLPGDCAMDVGHDVFNSSPGIGPFEGGRSLGNPAYTHTDTPAISLDSSKSDRDWSDRELKAGKSSGQPFYRHDSEQSISEDVKDIGDDLLLSSDKDESLDLTEDQTVSEIPQADYMEDIRHG